MKRRSIEIRYSKKFIKTYSKSPGKIKSSWRKRIKIFKNNQYSPVLKNHKLSGEYQGCNSINITGDWRAIFKYSEKQDLATFLLLGTHSQLYK